MSNVKITAEWIDVYKSLPEKFCYVLATIVSPVSKWVEVVGYGDGEWHLPGRTFQQGVSVTHWMKVPEPAVEPIGKKTIQQQQTERFADLYCDASGNCFTDAGPGL
jgi:hypothetical protein